MADELKSRKHTGLNILTAAHHLYVGKEEAAKAHLANLPQLRKALHVCDIFHRSGNTILHY